MATCPSGHQSDQSDFCDVCGLPMPEDQPGTTAAAPPVESGPQPVVCPNCQTPNVADALFCEACGYDFTTGTPPATAIPAAWPDSAPPPDVVTESDPVADFLAESPSAAARDTDGPDATDGSDATADAAGEPLPQPESPASPPAPLQRPGVDWVAELWIDPDWYAAQGSTDPMPSQGLPDIVPLVKESNLVGRVSHSRGIFPDVDCELDTGCSRRHAMLSTDGTRWWIEDLNSANGTFVGAAAGPLPAMPIPQGRVELTPGQRIYVGAWTRIVIREATDDEKEAFAS